MSWLADDQIRYLLTMSVLLVAAFGLWLWQQSRNH
jgi:hypothetical protein